MKEQSIKLQITNSVNDNESIEWFFCDTEEQKKEWIEEKKNDQIKWNTDTNGAVSYRYYCFDEYLTINLLEFDLSELKGIKLIDLVEIIQKQPL